MNVFDLFAKLSLDSSEYDEGLDKAESKGSKFGAGLKKAGAVAAAGVAAATGATIAAGKAFVDGVSDVAAYTDRVDKMSQKMNMSAESFQEWDFVMQHAGTSIDSMQASIKTLSNAAETSKDAFEKLGMSQEQIASMSGEELFNATITALQGVEDETERTYLAGQLLGRGATELGALLNMSADDVAEMKQQAHDLGGVLSDDTVKAGAGFQDSLQNMQTSLDGMKNRMLGDFMPALSTTMDGLSMIFSGSDVEGGMDKISGGIKTLADNLVKKAPEFMRIGGTILSALVSSISSNLPVLLNTAVPIIMELGQGIISHAPEILSAVLSLIGTIGSALGDPANLQSLLDTAMTLVMMISDSIATNAPTVIPAIVELIMTMLTALTDESNLMPLLEAGLSVITSLVQGILKALPILIKNLPTIISNITNFLIDSTPMIITAAVQLFMGIVQAIPEIISALIPQIPTIIATIVKGLVGGIGQIVAVGGQLLSGLWDGLSNKMGWLMDKIKSLGGTILNGIKNVFSVHSPSKKTAEIGKFLALGLGEGFEDEIGTVAKDIAKSASGVTDDLSEAMALESASIGASMNASTMKATGGFNTGSSSAMIEELGKFIDTKLSNVEFNVPVYIGQSKIEQQVVTAQAHRNAIAGGR